MTSTADELAEEVRVPRWVTVADILTVFFAFASVVTFFGGGVRFLLAGTRVSLTTPLPPLLLALAIGGVRHYRRPAPSLPEHLTAVLTHLWRVDAVRAVWRPFLLTRLAVLVIGLLAVYAIGLPQEGKPSRVSSSPLYNLPMRWDAGWYLSIASSGYDWTPRDVGKQRNIAFFPAFPMAMRAIGRVFGRTGVAYLYSGVFISHVAFFVALIFLFELARDDLGDAAAAGAAVILLASYPFSIFHGAVYTESLYLMGALGAVLAVKRARWTQAALWGLLVGLTRPNGFILSVTLAALILERQLRGKGGRWRDALSLPALAAVAAPVAGAAIYCAYIWQLTGNPLQWSAQHAAWGRTFTGFSPFASAAEFAAQNGMESYVEMVPYDFINAVPTICALALTIPIGRRLGWAYSVFILTNLVPPLLLGGFMSTGRLTATLFPLFIWLGAATGSSTPTVVISFAMLQSFAAALFYTWRPLY